MKILYKNTKNYFKISNYLSWYITIFIIISPIFLSYNNINDFSFSLIHYPMKGKDYLFTLPISIFFLVPFLLKGLINIHKDKVIFFFLIFFILINFLGYSTHQLPFLLLLLKIITPILAMLGLEIFFKKKFKHTEQKITNIIVKRSNILKFLFTIIFAISIMSPFYLKNPYAWLIPEIVIFNYFQYFPLIFIILLGMLATRSHIFIFLLVYILSFYLSYITSNLTFFLILIIFGLYCLLSIIFKRYLVFLTQSYIVFLITIVFCYLLFVYIFGLNLYEIYNKLGLHKIYNIDGFAGRINAILSFYNQVSFFEFLNPIKIISGIPSKTFHNEFIVLTSAIGFFGAILFYFILIKRIWFISKNYPSVSIALTLYAIFSGIFITTNLHPYTQVISAFFVSYYFIISKFKLT